MGLLDTLNTMASGINDTVFNFDAPKNPQEAAERARRNALLAASAPTTDFNMANLGATLLAGNNAYTDAYNNQMTQDINTNTYNQQMQLKQNLPQILSGMGLDANTKLLLQSMPPNQVSQALSTIALTPKTYKYHFSDQYGVYVTDNKGGMQKVAEAGTEWVQLKPEDVVNRGLDPNKSWQVNRNGETKQIGGGGVNITTTTGKEFMQGAIEKYFDRDLGGAIDTLGKVQQMITLLDEGVKTGAGVQSLNTFKKYLATAGFNFDAETLDMIAKTEQFGALSKNMILPLVKALGYNPTDADLRFIVEANPDLGKTPQGNMLLLKTLQRIKEAEIQVAQWEDAYFGGKNNPDGSFTAGINMFENVNTYQTFMRHRAEMKGRIMRQIQQDFKEDSQAIIAGANNVTHDVSKLSIAQLEHIAAGGKLDANGNIIIIQKKPELIPE